MRESILISSCLFSMDGRGREAYQVSVDVPSAWGGSCEKKRKKEIKSLLGWFVSPERKAKAEDASACILRTFSGVLSLRVSRTSRISRISRLSLLSHVSRVQRGSRDSGGSWNFRALLISGVSFIFLAADGLAGDFAAAGEAEPASFVSNTHCFDRRRHLEHASSGPDATFSHRVLDALHSKQDVLFRAPAVFLLQGRNIKSTAGTSAASLFFALPSFSESLVVSDSGTGAVVVCPSRSPCWWWWAYGF